jgi:hypothetical protein
VEVSKTSSPGSQTLCRLDEVVVIHFLSRPFFYHLDQNPFVMAFKRSRLSLYILHCTLLQLCAALELQPVRMDEFTGQHRILGRRETSALDLQSYETFLWEAPGQFLSLTVSASQISRSDMF